MKKGKTLQEKKAMKPGIKHILYALLFALFYFLCARIGDMMSFKPSNFTTFWLPGGLYVSVLLLVETRFWPLYILGAITANITFDLAGGKPLWLSLIFCCANTSEAFTGAFLIRKYIKPFPTLSKLKEIYGLVIFSALLSTMLSATFGALGVKIAFPDSEYSDTWRMWWSGDLIGVLVFAPLVITFIKRVVRLKFLPPAKIAEASVLILCVLIASGFLFRDKLGLIMSHNYASVPLVLWAAFRFGVPGAAVVSFLLSFFASLLILKNPDQIVWHIGETVADKITSLQIYQSALCVTGLITSAIISELRASRLILRKQEALLDEVQRITKVGGWEYDIETQKIFWTKEVYAIHECPANLDMKTALEQSINCYNEPYRQMITEALNNAVYKGEPYCIEAEFTTFKGKQLWIRTSGEPVFEDGRIVRVIGNIIDITETKLTAKALKTSEEKYRTMIETSTEGILAINPDFRVSFINQKMLNMLGYSHEEIIGKRVYELISEEDKEDHKKRMQERASGKNDTYERTFKRKDGSPCVCIVSATALKDQDGKFSGSFAMFTDISDRKKIENELVRSSALLDSIRKVQNSFIVSHDVKNVFYDLLKVSIELSKSQYGFLDEVCIDKNGNYYKKNLCLTNISWDEDSDKLYKKLSSDDFKFTNLNNLAGNPVVSGKLVISNDPHHDSRSGGIPHGHPALDCFMGIPMYYSGELVGVLGLANKTGGYSEEDASYLEPFVSTCAALIHSYKNKVKEESFIESLQKSEEKYKMLFNEMMDGFALHEMIYDDNGTPIDYRFVVVNPAFERFTGLKAENIIGRSVLELMPHTEKYWIENYGKVAETGEPMQFENYSEEIGKYFEVSAFSPKKGQFACIFVDVTERRLAQKAIEEKTNELDRFFNLSLDLLCIADTDGHFRRLNPAWEDVLGYEINEMTGKQFFNFVHPDDVSSTREALLALGSGKSVINFINRYMCKNGSYRWIEWRSAPYQEKLVYAAARDITERILAEETIKEAEAKYRMLFDQSPFGIILYHPVTTLPLEFNEIAHTQLGYTREEFKTRRIHDYEVKENQDQIMEKVTEILQSKVLTFETIHRRKDGILRDILVASRIINIKQNPYILSILQDITEYKNAEHEKQRLHDQLTQAQKMESIGRLAGGVAHDFNNMLSVIMGYTEMIIGDSVVCNGKLKDSLNEVYKAGERAKSLTNQLLAFGRKQILEIKILDLNKIIVNFGKMLIRIIGENISISTVLDPNIGLIRADETQIEQILLNLAVNARDAMDKGGRIVIETLNVNIENSISSADGVISGKYVQMIFKDTGTGMNKDVQKMIFEPFFTTKEKGKGTGLGLSTVYGIVKQHGGDIQVYSEPEKGTSFMIIFPRVEEKTDELSEIKEEDIIQGGGETILVIEDDQSVRKLAFAMLSEQGYNVIETSDCHDAIDKASKLSHIDLILTDVVMPDMNGRQVYDEINAIHTGIKVLYMSGYSEDIIGYHGVLNEGVHFICKPFTQKRIAKKVREVLDK